MRRALDLARGVLTGPRSSSSTSPTLGLDPAQRAPHLELLLRLARSSGRRSPDDALLEEADRAPASRSSDRGLIIAEGTPTS